MTGWCHARNGSESRPWISTLLAVVILVRALVPVGFMPDLSRLADGVYEIVVCTGDGLGTITVDSAGDPVSPDGSGSAPVQNSLCPFAAAAAVALATIAVVFFASFRWPSRVFFSLPETRLAAVCGWVPLGARAPPFS